MIHRVVTMLRSWGFHLLFVWSFLFAGIATLGWGIWNSLEAFSSRSWPEAVGKITFSTVASYESDSNSGTTTMFYPDIRYNYSVNGKEFTGNKVDLGEYSSSDVGYAQKITARYPVGKSVRVYYDPAHPGTAVLEPGFTGGLWIPLVIGGVFSVVGGALSYFFFRLIFQGRFEETLIS